jgi:GTP pyrophosphokinase
VNGRLVPLSRELRNSETVEILRAPGARPSRDWLAHVRTGRARHKIRQWLRHEEQKASVAVGQEILEREIKRRRHPKLNDDQLRAAAETLKLNDANHLYASIAHGDVNVTQVLRALYPDFDERDDASLKASPLERLLERVKSVAPSPKGLKIQGVDGLMVRYAACCQPVPGDKVVGYVTRGRGVSVHRGDCPNLLQLAHEPERRLDIVWNKTEGERFTVRLAIEGTDRRGLYADLATAVSETGTDIRSLELKSVDGRLTGAALVDVENLAQLEKILKAIRKVKGVAEVARRERLTSES